MLTQMYIHAGKNESYQVFMQVSPFQDMQLSRTGSKFQSETKSLIHLVRVTQPAFAGTRIRLQSSVAF